VAPSGSHEMTPEQNSHDNAEKPVERERASDNGSPDRPGASVTLSPAEFEELMTLAKERDEYLKRLQRAVADYQNLQKRMERFREVTRMDVFRSLAEGILPVADNLDLALEAARRADGCEEIVRGLELTAKNFYEALDRLGIRPVEAMGQKFRVDDEKRMGTGRGYVVVIRVDPKTGRLEGACPGEFYGGAEGY